MNDGPDLKWETNPDVPQGTPALTFTCSLCFALVTDRAGHQAFHALNIPGAVDQNLGSFQIQKKYGIEFEDESADSYEYDTLPEALEEYKKYRVDHAKQMRKYGESDYAGMRLMVRTVVTSTSEWEPYAHPVEPAQIVANTEVK